MAWGSPHPCVDLEGLAEGEQRMAMTSPVPTARQERGAGLLHGKREPKVPKAHLRFGAGPGVSFPPVALSSRGNEGG